MIRNANIKKKPVAKPFVKWAGGKGNLLNVLKDHLPNDFSSQNDVTYVEPFVGGGAMLFYMLNTFKNIKHVLINDINRDLIRCYMLVKDEPQTLIDLLKPLSRKYFELRDDARSSYFYEIRDEYNSRQLTENQRAAYLIFLNQTCFRGLYRENSNGGFNVPFGNYKRPNICNSDVIMADHEVLSKVDIICGEYKNVLEHLDEVGYTFIYLDPPYRPLLVLIISNSIQKVVLGTLNKKNLKPFAII